MSKILPSVGDQLTDQLIDQLEGFSGGGSNIKSIQRGQFTFGSTVQSVNINAVDRDKSIALISFAPAGTAMDEALTAVEFVDDTTIRFRRGDGNNNVNVAWQVIEFENVKSVQSGQNSMNSGTVNVAINEVDISKSILFESVYTDYTSGNIDRKPNGRISSSTQISFFVDEANSLTQVYWFVIEFN